MKQIGTTENGILMELTKEESSLLKQFDLPAMLKVRSLVGEIAAVFTGKGPTATPKAKKHYKKRITKAAPAVNTPVQATEKKPTLVEIAIETMKQINRPCSMEDVVAAMKARGCTFKSEEPTSSLGIQLTQAKAAILVGRDGKKGLWMINGPEAIAERKRHLISLGKN